MIGQSRASARPDVQPLGQYMTVEPVGTEPEVWIVRSKRARLPLGTVEWWSGWRRYVFSPESGAIFDRECLRHLADFCESASARIKVQP